MLTLHFGPLGALIGHIVKKVAKKEDEEPSGESINLIQNSYPPNTHQILNCTSESAKPQPGGALQIFPSGRKKKNFEFETTQDMSAALNLLPQLLNSSLAVNDEWDEHKKRYRKKKVQS
jgi:hypothetical protein